MLHNNALLTIITLPSVVISSAHYSLAGIRLIFAVGNYAYITLPYVIGPIIGYS